MSMSELYSKQIVTILRWIARVLGTLLCMLIAAFAIGEGFPDPLTLSLPEQLLFAGMITMLLGLIAAWRWEFIGGVLILVGYTFFMVVEQRIIFFNIVFGPLLITGILYLFCWWRTRKASLVQK
ncbi:MAG: hypothetical protein U9P14_06740 [Gemmatimonadota bacterium]|nr:hypothetical protein [Gemmatimonadota bacterium]